MDIRTWRKLSRILSSCSNSDEQVTLLQGLLTPKELDEIMERWELMIRLQKGMPQRAISEELGISLGKIARGSRLLQFGPPEFKQLLARIEQESQDEQTQ